MRFWAILIVLLFLAFGCQKTENNHGNNNDNVVPIKLTDSLEGMKNHVYVKYKIPLPLELFDYLSNKSQFSAQVLTSTAKVHQFLSDKHKAIGLGIYNADLAYCSILQNAQMALEYFKVSKQLAQDLSIEDGYSEYVFERLNQNINNPDSIRRITDEAYWRACNFLDSNHRYNILPFVVVGGWFESMALIIKTDRTKDKRQIKDLIIKQNNGFKNVQHFLYDVQMESSAYHYYKDFRRITAEIQRILDLYEKYQIAPLAQQPDIYFSIINEILSYRDKLLNGKF